MAEVFVINRVRADLFARLTKNHPDIIGFPVIWDGVTGYWPKPMPGLVIQEHQEARSYRLPDGAREDHP